MLNSRFEHIITIKDSDIGTINSRRNNVCDNINYRNEILKSG